MYLYVKQECKRAFISYRMLIATIASIGVVFLSIFGYFLSLDSPAMSLTYIFFSSYSYGTTTFLPLLFPLICSLPFTTSLIEDRKSGIHNYFLYRFSPIRYITIKLCINGLAGAIAVIIGPVVLMLTLISIRLINGTQWFLADSISSIDYFHTLQIESPYSMMLLVIVFIFIASLLFSTIGLAISTIIKNVYITWLFPFILFIFTGVGLNLISNKFYLLRIYDPSYSNSSLWSTGLLTVVLFIIAIGLYYWKARKYDEQSI